MLSSMPWKLIQTCCPNLLPCPAQADQCQGLCLLPCLCQALVVGSLQAASLPSPLGLAWQYGAVHVDKYMQYKAEAVQVGSAASEGTWAGAGLSGCMLIQGHLKDESMVVQCPKD